MTKSQIHNLLSEITRIVFEQESSQKVQQRKLSVFLRKKGVGLKEVIQVVQEDVSHPSTRDQLLKALNFAN